MLTSRTGTVSVKLNGTEQQPLRRQIHPECKYAASFPTPEFRMQALVLRTRETSMQWAGIPCFLECLSTSSIPDYNAKLQSCSQSHHFLEQFLRCLILNRILPFLTCTQTNILPYCNETFSIGLIRIILKVCFLLFKL